MHRDCLASRIFGAWCVVVVFFELDPFVVIFLALLKYLHSIVFERQLHTYVVIILLFFFLETTRTMNKICIEWQAFECAG